MSRVLPSQAPLLSLDSERYVALRPIGDAEVVAGVKARVAEKEREEREKEESGNASAAPKDKKSKSNASTLQDKKLSGGSIVLLRDTKPEVEGEYLELDKSLWPADVPPPVVVPGAEAEGVTGAGAGAGATAGGAGEIAAENINEDEEAGVPPSFEYPFDD